MARDEQEFKLMIKLLEDNTVLCSDGFNVNSGHPDKTGCAKSAAVATAFTYRHDINYNREDREHVDVLSFDNSCISIECYVCEAQDNPDGPSRLTSAHSHQQLTLDPMEDQSKFSDRVKLFASIVFDAAAKAEFIASLPTVDVETDGDPVIVERVVPAVTVPKVINGVLTHVVTQEEAVVEDSIPATQAFIDYKGKLYAEGELA